MGEIISIKVSIGNRNYPLRVEKQEEDKIIQAADSINKKIKELEENYAVKDKQDLLAMCTLHYAVESMVPNKPQPESNREPHTSDKLTKLHLLIDEYLAADSVET